MLSGSRSAGPLGYPHAGRRAGKGGEDDVLHAAAPEFAGYDGGVRHAAAWLDAGDEGRGPCRGRHRGERATGYGRGEGLWGDALAGADARELGEDLGAVDVFLVQGRAEGADVGDGDDQGDRP